MFLSQMLSIDPDTVTMKINGSDILFMYRDRAGHGKSLVTTVSQALKTANENAVIPQDETAFLQTLNVKGCQVAVLGEQLKLQYEAV